jgi:large repetitive protein
MRTSGVILAICCCLSLSVAMPVRPHFSPRDAVRRVRAARATFGDHRPSVSRLDAGEFIVDTSITHGSAPDGQDHSAVASDGENFLVVWEDYRGEHNGVYGARVTPQGTLLDPAGVFIAEARFDQGAPAVAFGGGRFLVVWSEDDDDRIYGARVTPQGVVLDTAAIAVSQAAAYQCFPAVGFDGASFLVAWEDYRNGGRANIYGARVTPAGSVLDTAGIVITQAADEQLCPAVGFDGAKLLVAWEDYRNGQDANIYGARVTPTGEVLDTAGVVILQGPSDQCSPDLAFDGTNFLAVCADWRNGGDIYGARVTPQGQVLDSAGFAIFQKEEAQDNPTLAFDGANFLVVWDDRRDSCDIHGARVTPQGTVLDTAGIAISPAAGGQFQPAIAFGGASFLATWDDYRGDENVCGSRVTPQGVVLDTAGTVISQAANGQQSPVIASDGTDFLVAWQDYHGGSGSCDIYGSRVTSQGTVLDPAGFVISQRANDQLNPALAFDGTNFLVVWNDVHDGGDWDIYGARVTPQGQVLDTAGIAISQNANTQCYPALAFDGANFLVVWYDRFNGGTSSDICGARVTPAGAVLDTAGIAISQSDGNQSYPAIASDGTNLLVVWSDWRSGGGNVYGARVTPQGVVLDTAGFDISRAPSGSISPDLCFDGTNFLVVWDDYRSLDWKDIYGARVAPQSTVLDSTGFVISHAGHGRSAPAPAFDGTNFLVAWHDSRSGSDCDIYGARVTPGGTVFEGGSILSKQGNQLYPGLCCGGNGQMFIVYQDWAGTQGGKTYNAYRIWGMMDPNPGVAETMNDERGMMNARTTVVRGVLFLPPSLPTANFSLFSIDGRKVLDLKPGANDVRALAPGVYFVRDVQAQAQVIRKIVITR